MKRIASPMVGGMVSATVLTLVVIPAVYVLWRRGQIGKRPQAVARSAQTADTIKAVAETTV
jgi:Cu(I)/Ag(I) efflux system membrane protein CusA/SilA